MIDAELTTWLSAKTDLPQEMLVRRMEKATLPGKVIYKGLYAGPNGEPPHVFAEELCDQWGMVWPHIVFGKFFFDDPDHPDPKWINESLFRSHLQAIQPGKMVVLDLEGPTFAESGMGWTPYWYDEPHGRIDFRRDIMEKRLKIGEIVRAERPDLKWGWWSNATCDMPSWIWSFPLYNDWLYINASLRPLRDQADFTMPYFYAQSPWAVYKGTTKPVEWAPLHVQLSLLTRLIMETRATDGWEKDILVWLMPQWYDLWQLPGMDCEMSARLLQAYLHTAYYLGGNDEHFGVCLWAGQPRNGVLQPWNENADWWQVLKSLLLLEGITPQKGTA